MSDHRCWLVDREINDKGMITLTYATIDGRRYIRRHKAATASVEVTAAIDVTEDRLIQSDSTDIDRFAAEASRMENRRDPDEIV